MPTLNPDDFITNHGQVRLLEKVHTLGMKPAKLWPGDERFLVKLRDELQCGIDGTKFLKELK